MSSSSRLPSSLMGETWFVDRHERFLSNISLTEESLLCVLCSSLMLKCHRVLIKQPLLLHPRWSHKQHIGLRSFLLFLVFFRGFSGQLAALTQWFRHNWKNADWLWSTKTDWKRFRMQLRKMDVHDFTQLLCETERSLRDRRGWQGRNRQEGEEGGRG